LEKRATAGVFNWVEEGPNRVATKKNDTVLLEKINKEEGRKRGGRPKGVSQLQRSY